MTWLHLTELGGQDRKYWVNSNNICHMRENRFAKKYSVLLIFDVDFIKTDSKMNDVTYLKELHVKHSMEEIMAMVDKPALLAQLMSDP